MGQFTLKPTAPFRLDLTVWVLRRLPINHMDDWDGKIYRRVFVIDDAPITIEAIQQGTANHPEILVTTHGGRLGTRRQEKLTAQLERMLGLRVDLRPFYKLAKSDRRLGELTAPFKGFRPPRLASVFETMLTGIACQQVSLSAGIHFLNRTSRAFGLSMNERYAFARPTDLATNGNEAVFEKNVRQLREIGFSGRKARTILSIAQAEVDGQLDLEGLSDVEDQPAMERLLQIKGIGRWTAEYVLLRGLGRLDNFPGDDVGGQAKLQLWLGLKNRPDYDAVHRLLADWEPYRGLLYFYLLLNHQKRLGLIA